MSGETVDGVLVDPLDLLMQRQAELEDASARHQRAVQAEREARRAYVAWRFDDAVTAAWRASWHAQWREAAAHVLGAAAAADVALDAYVQALQGAAGRPS
jgi:sigma54-dependent transcription regulator